MDAVYRWTNLKSVWVKADKTFEILARLDGTHINVRLGIINNGRVVELRVLNKTSR